MASKVLEQGRPPSPFDGPPPGSRPRSEAEQQEDARRRSKITPACFSHSAMRVSDLRKTREFYEDVIGLPMVRADRIKQAPVPGRGPPYDMIHAFFELADGSMVAFFEADKTVCDPDHVFPRDPLQLHFAVRMPSEQSIRDAEVRVRTAGYECMYVPHPDALSLYIDDPDGLQFELIYHWENFDTSLDPEGARRSLEAWYENGQRWN